MTVNRNASFQNSIWHYTNPAEYLLLVIMLAIFQESYFMFVAYHFRWMK